MSQNSRFLPDATVMEFNGVETAVDFSQSCPKEMMIDLFTAPHPI